MLTLLASATVYGIGVKDHDSGIPESGNFSITPIIKVQEHIFDCLTLSIIR